jgi:hypothetical protein
LVALAENIKAERAIAVGMSEKATGAEIYHFADGPAAGDKH